MPYSFEYQPIKNRAVTVRKAHRCDWCDERIDVDEPAQYRVYKYQDDFNHGWMHPECNTAMETSPPDLIEEGWDVGMFKRGSQEER